MSNSVADCGSISINEYRTCSHGRYYISYPDVVMPGFLFATGLSFRLSHQRSVQRLGLWRARLKIFVPRALGLLILSYWLYGFGGGRLSWAESLAIPPLQRAVSFFGSYFGALTQIALTTVWCLPVIERSVAVRVAYAVVSQALYFGYVTGVAVSTANFDYMVGEEGGPVGFLSWAFPLLAGSIMCDSLESLAVSHPPQSSGGSSCEESRGTLIAASGYAARARARCAAYVDVLLGTAGATWTTPAAVYKRLMWWTMGGCGMLLLGCEYGAGCSTTRMFRSSAPTGLRADLASMLALVLPIFCFDLARNPVAVADAARVPMPLPPFITPPASLNAAVVTAWSAVRCWVTWTAMTTGLQVVFCATCFWVCDVKRWRVWGLHNVLDAFGRNAIVAYYCHFGARRNVAAFLPTDSPGSIVFLGLLLCLGSLYLGLAHLRSQRVFVSI